MSIEGGPFQCSITGETFERTDIEGWNKHCTGKHKDLHTFSGTTVCQECGQELRFTKHPYIPLLPDAHLKREVQLYCSKHPEMNPSGVEIENMGGTQVTVTHGDTQKT